MFKRANHLSVRSVVALVIAVGLGVAGLVSLVSAVTSPFTQTDWSTGDFSASSQVTTATAGQITLATPEKLTNPAFLTDVSSWSAVVATPSGWIEVPNNALYSPPTGNFLVMQYEAKYDANGDGDGDTPAEANAAGACTGVTGCVADAGAGLDYRDIVGFNKEKVVSSANGAPLVHITQTQAIAACPTGYHLITNKEWMTLSRNIEAQSANWANGTINSTVASGGGLKRGNVGITDSASYNGSDPEYGTGRDTKAKHVLSNGAETWDLSGNVWEWNSDTIVGTDKPHNNTGAWVEWTVFTPPGASTYGSLSYDLTRPSNSSLNADYGIGRYYEGSNTGGPYAFLRGGSWGSGAGAGVATLSLNDTPGIQDRRFGSRCASDPVAILPSYLPSSGRSGSGGAQVAVGSIADAYFSQSVNVGDTSTYYFSAYVYNNTAGSVGGVVDAAVASLYYGGNTITNPVYTAVVGETGWYLLTGTVTGVASNTQTGLVVKKGKTVIVDDVSLNQYSATGSLTSSIIDTEFASGSEWGTLTYNATTPTDTSVVVKLRTSNSPSMTGAADFSTCTAISSGSDISSNGCVTDSHRYFQYQAELATSDELVTPTFQDLTLEFVTFDAVAPSIALTALAPDPNSDNTPTLTGTASDVTGNVTAVEFQMDGTAGSWTACTADDSSFNSPSEAFSCTVTEALSDGTHTMNVRASDSNGNTTADGSVTSDTLMIDVTAPTVPGAPSTTSPTADTTPTWNWTASSDATSGLATPPYTVEWSASETFASGVFSSTASSNSFTHVTPLTDGTWYFRVRSSDLADNQSPNSSIGSVQINTGAPTGSVSINSGGEYTNTRVVTLSLTASSGLFTGTSDIQMKVSNLPDLSDASYEAFASSKTWTLPSGDGSKTVYVQFKDSTSNESGAYTDTIVLDTTAPSGFDLQEPGHQAYTNNERPSFKWRAASNPDATAGLSQYKLEIDNGETGDFSIDNISPSRTTTDETTQYKIEYQNFEDGDESNNYILVTTKSSLLWGLGNYDGRLKEGKREWKVVAVDRAGNETSQSRTLFVDRTGPRTEVTQINSVPCQANYSSASTRLVKNTQGDGSCAFSTSDTTPTIFGLVTDPLSGESDSDSEAVRQDNQVASGPKQVEVRIEKLGSNGIYELHSLATVNLRENYWVHDGSIITDTTLQDSDKFSSFEFAPQESLGRGSFRAKLYGRDLTGNTGGQVMVYFTIADFQKVATPEQIQIATEEIEEYIEQELPTATGDEKEQIREELLEQVEVTVPEEPVQISQTEALQAYWAEVRASLSQITKGLLVYIQQVGQQGWLALVESWRQPQQLTSRLLAWVNYSTTSFGELVLDNQPTMISEVKVEQMTPTTAVITWKTNHLATSKVNYGLTKDYGQDVQFSQKVHEHRVEITGLEPGVTYNYEVMSQNGNYVYDANHEFTTPVE